LPALINEFGYSVIYSNLLTVPIYSVNVALVMFNTYHSDITRERPLHVIIPGFVAMISWCLVALNLSNIVAKYIVLLFSSVCCHVMLPVILAWTTDITKGQTSVATATAIIVGFGNIGGAVGPQIFGISFTSTGSYAWAADAMAFAAALSVFGSFLLWFLLRRYGNSKDYVDVDVFDDLHEQSLLLPKFNRTT